MKKKGELVIIIILIVCVVGLIGYILVDKNVINFGNSEATENNESVSDDNSNDTTVEVAPTVELDSANESIVTLFNNAHRYTIGPWTTIYRDGGYKVSEMSMEDKMTLLSSQWLEDVENYPVGTDQNLTYINESTLKNDFERTFGPNTYAQVGSITDGCIILTYDATNKRYSTTQAGGCGGTTAFDVYETIISATKYSDRIEIVSATIYVDGMSNQMYKDYNKTTPLGEPLITENTVDNTEERENTYNQYIKDHKDNLEQYTYTYMLNEDGFYYLGQVARTKS